MKRGGLQWRMGVKGGGGLVGGGGVGGGVAGNVERAQL